MREGLPKEEQLEGGQETSKKVARVFEIRDMQMSLMEEIERAKRMGREPLQFVDAFNKSNLEAEEIMKDPGVLKEVVGKAFREDIFVDQRELAREVKPRIETFINEFLRSKGLAEKIEVILEDWSEFLNLGEQENEYKNAHRGLFTVMLKQQTKIWVGNVLTPEDMREIKEGIVKIMSEAMGSAITTLDVEHSAYKPELWKHLIGVKAWPLYFWDKIDIKTTTE